MLTGRLPVMTQELPSTRWSFGTPARASGPSGTARPVWNSSTTIEKEDDMTGEPIHLGKELCENLDVLGMSPAELCRRIEVPVSRITEIVNVRRAVTGDTALRPCRVFGTSGQFWLNLQQLYELRHAEERKGAAITCVPSPDGDYRSWARGRHSAITVAAAARKVIYECRVRGKRWLCGGGERRQIRTSVRGSWIESACLLPTDKIGPDQRRARLNAGFLN